MVAFWSPYGRAAGSRLHADASADWFYTGVPSPLFNGVLRADTDRSGAVALIDRLRAEIERGGAPALWWIGSRSRPAELGQMLEQNGLAPAGDVPAMAIDLESLPGAAETIDGFSIRKVENAAQRRLWAQIAATGTGFSAEATAALAALETRIADAQYEAQIRYLGFLNEVPVATSALVLEHGVAGVYAVATLPDARRKGIGSAMTTVPLVDARALGYRVGILQSSSAGHSIYKKLGFKDIYHYALFLQSR